MSRGCAFLAAGLLLSCSDNYGLREPVETDVAKPDPAPRPVIQPPPATPPPVKSAGTVELELGMPTGTLVAQGTVEYLADIGDTLSVIFLSHPKLTQDAQVTPDGTLVVLQVGAVQVRGRTLAEVQKAILEQAAAAGIKAARVTVAVKMLSKKFITVVGAGLTGGRTEIQGRGTLLECLAGSGWKPERRAGRRVALIRNGRTSVLELDQITGLSNISLNVRLQANDMVVIMDKDPVEVKGAVGAPGPYAMPPAGEMRLRDAIALAGGVKLPAELTAVQILRASGASETYDLNEVLFGKPQEGDRLMVRAGDVLYIPPARQTTIYVLGMVNRPGALQVTGPVNVARALAMADNHKFGAVLEDTRLVRGYPNKPEVIRINYAKVFGGDPLANITMVEGDVLYVPESALSDVLDTVSRILAPLSGAVGVPAQVYTVGQVGK